MKPCSGFQHICQIVGVSTGISSLAMMTCGGPQDSMFGPPGVVHYKHKMEMIYWILGAILGTASLTLMSCHIL